MTRQEALDAILRIKDQSAYIRPSWTELIEVVEILLRTKE